MPPSFTMLFLLFTTTLLMMSWQHYAGRIVFLSLAAYFFVVANVFAHVSDAGATLLLWQGLVRVDEGILLSLLFLTGLAEPLMRFLEIRHGVLHLSADLVAHQTFLGQ